MHQFKTDTKKQVHQGFSALFHIFMAATVIGLTLVTLSLFQTGGVLDREITRTVRLNLVLSGMTVVVLFVRWVTGPIKWGDISVASFFLAFSCLQMAITEKGTNATIYITPLTRPSMSCSWAYMT
jgi:hypothetical protein